MILGMYMYIGLTCTSVSRQEMPADDMGPTNKLE